MPSLISVSWERSPSVELFKSQQFLPVQRTKSAARTMSAYACVLWIVKSAYLSNSRPISALLHLSCQHLCSVMPCWKLSAGSSFEDYTHLIYAKYMPSTLHKIWRGQTPLFRDSWAYLFYATSGSPSGSSQYFPRAATAEIKAVSAGLTHWGTEHKGGHTAAAELGGG